MQLKVKMSKPNYSHTHPPIPVLLQITSQVKQLGIILDSFLFLILQNHSIALMFVESVTSFSSSLTRYKFELSLLSNWMRKKSFPVHLSDFSLIPQIII